MLIGEKTAEEIKIQIGSAMPDGDPEEMKVKARSCVWSSKEVTITDSDIRKAMYSSVSQIIDGIKR